MSVVIVTGSAGLIGSETVQYFCELGFDKNIEPHLKSEKLEGQRIHRGSRPFTFLLFYP